jgi:hypothetical protein
VLKVEQVDFLADAGAKLIVTPNTAGGDPPGGGAGMLVCAGCATATEAFSALDAGAQWLKIFPSSTIRPGLYSRAESGAAAGGAGAGGRRRDAGNLATGSRRDAPAPVWAAIFIARTGRGTYPRAGGEVYRRQ